MVKIQNVIDRLVSILREKHQINVIGVNHLVLHQLLFQKLFKILPVSRTRRVQANDWPRFSLAGLHQR
ncbi:MAG: hypothetical protein BWY44_01339 [Candidatus Omnitrophica bacterium ADurb.Bin292]|nr:MAG: hypothetical protein BWY44_01339 [Candidatus Omnitrophica bacterium ADurb.Bin292]